MPDKLLTIGELSRRTGRPPSAIRYYERLGLLPEPARVGGQRRYRPECARTLAVIGTAQRAGLSLAEIKSFLGAALGEQAAMSEFRGIAARKLPEVTAMIERATLIRKWLAQAARCECPDLDECPLFEEEPGGGLPAPTCPDEASPLRPVPDHFVRDHESAVVLATPRS